MFGNINFYRLITLKTARFTVDVYWTSGSVFSKPSSNTFRSGKHLLSFPQENAFDLHRVGGGLLDTKMNGWLSPAQTIAKVNCKLHSQCLCLLSYTECHKSLSNQRL
jgi:hypothetical protein